jgi:hypothetical protein
MQLGCNASILVSIILYWFDFVLKASLALLCLLYISILAATSHKLSQISAFVSGLKTAARRTIVALIGCDYEPMCR